MMFDRPYYYARLSYFIFIKSMYNFCKKNIFNSIKYQKTLIKYGIVYKNINNTQMNMFFGDFNNGITKLR